jgi:3-isopropylmalate/(R)-2-methylmalate dehydratase large subunit
MGPENGITLPGATIVCGDSTLLTVPLDCWIGYFEVEMVLSTQCIMQPKPKKMLINVAGDLQGYTKDVALILYQNYPPQALLVILWNTRKSFETHEGSHDRL